MFIKCLKQPIDVLMKLLLSTDDDDEHQELNHRNGNDIVEDAKDEERQSLMPALTLKSSLRKVNSIPIEGERKKKKNKVQWVDAMGKDLAEIREFESSEEDDMDYEQEKKCACVIL